MSLCAQCVCLWEGEGEGECQLHVYIGHVAFLASGMGFAAFLLDGWHVPCADLSTSFVLVF